MLTATYSFERLAAMIEQRADYRGWADRIGRDLRPPVDKESE